MIDIARGRTTGGCPWAMMKKQPADFMDLETYLPKVRAGTDGYVLNGVEYVSLQDPSRMVSVEIDACLKHWKERQDGGLVPFAFHHYMKTTGKMVAAETVAIVEDDSGEKKRRHKGNKSSGYEDDSSDEGPKTTKTKVSLVAKGKRRQRSKSESSTSDESSGTESPEDPPAIPVKTKRKGTQVAKGTRIPSSTNMPTPAASRLPTPVVEARKTGLNTLATLHEESSEEPVHPLLLDNTSISSGMPKYTLEQLLDMVAQKQGISRYSLRLSNIIDEVDLPPMPKPDIDLSESESEDEEIGTPVKPRGRRAPSVPVGLTTRSKATPKIPPKPVVQPETPKKPKKTKAAPTPVKKAGRGRPRKITTADDGPADKIPAARPQPRQKAKAVEETPTGEYDGDLSRRRSKRNKPT